MHAASRWASGWATICLGQTKEVHVIDVDLIL
jgi:hypothetical protein